MLATRIPGDARPTRQDLTQVSGGPGCRRCIRKRRHVTDLTVYAVGRQAFPAMALGRPRGRMLGVVVTWPAEVQQPGLPSGSRHGSGTCKKRGTALSSATTIHYTHVIITFLLRSVLVGIESEHWGLAVKWLSGECHRNSLMISQLIQVMAWCRKPTSHYLRRFWSSSVSPFDGTRPQRVNHHCL